MVVRVDYDFDRALTPGRRLAFSFSRRRVSWLRGLARGTGGVGLARVGAKDVTETFLVK